MMHVINSNFQAWQTHISHTTFVTFASKSSTNILCENALALKCNSHKDAKGQYNVAFEYRAIKFDLIDDSIAKRLCKQRPFWEI